MENTATVDGTAKSLNPAGDIDAIDYGSLGRWNRNQPLGLWDSENCPIPNACDPEILLIALGEYLKTLNFDSNFKLLGIVGEVTNPDRIPPGHVEHLTSRGVEFSSAPKDADGNVPQDAADHVILDKLKRFRASGVKVPLIIVAGDGIYNKYLQQLVAEDYDVVWIYPKSSTSAEMLENLDAFARNCYEDLMRTHMSPWAYSISIRREV